MTFFDWKKALCDLGVKLNLRQKKSVRNFYIVSSLYDSIDQPLPNKKKSSLTCLCPKLYGRKKSTIFKKRLYFGRPLYIVSPSLDPQK